MYKGDPAARELAVTSAIAQNAPRTHREAAIIFLFVFSPPDCGWSLIRAGSVISQMGLTMHYISFTCQETALILCQHIYRFGIRNGQLRAHANLLTQRNMDGNQILVSKIKYDGGFHITDRKSEKTSQVTSSGHPDNTSNLSRSILQPSKQLSTWVVNTSRRYYYSK